MSVLMFGFKLPSKVERRRRIFFINTILTSLVCCL